MKKRSPNFNTSEIDFLLDAVKKYRGTIECKRTDRVGSEEKLNAWKSVEREFNCKFTPTFRSYKVLKTKYFNIKATAKQNFAFDKRKTYATGGDPQQKTVTTKTDKKNLEICQETQILGKPSTYDCDGNNYEFSDIEVIYDIPEKVGGEVQKSPDPKIKEEDANTSWSKYTPKMLKKSLHGSLSKRKEKETTKDCRAKVASYKVERQKLEIKHLKEKHILEMEKLKLEIDLIRLKIENVKKP